MTTALTIEERVAVLEREMAELKKGNSPIQTKPKWIDNITGSFKGDPEFGEILRLGQQIRKAEGMNNSNGDA